MKRFNRGSAVFLILLFSNFGSGLKGIDDKDVVTGLARIEILRENLCTACFFRGSYDQGVPGGRGHAAWLIL
jgi:hypothetical protein